MNYQEIINNVNSFYTDGSAAVDYLNSLDLNGEQLGQIIDATDRFDVVRNADGEIINFTQKVDKVIGDTSALNSNIGSSTQASVNIPLTSTELQTGKLLIGQGVTGGMSGVQFLVGSILPAFAAVGTGIELGKKIDSTLYNLNPDFWDAQGMGALNPETWNTITTNDTVLGRVFNMLWGLDPETGTAQPYIDQNALAYLVGYMISQGVFDVGESYYQQAPTQTLHYDIYGKIYASDTSPIWDHYAASQPKLLRLENVSGVKYCLRDFGGVDFYLVSENYFGGLEIQVSYDNGSTWSRYGISSGSTAMTQWGKTYYFASVSTGTTSDRGTGSIPYIEVNQTTQDSPKVIWDICDIIFRGTEVQGGSGVTGIDDQTGATQFDASGISNPTDIADVLAALQAQFPTLFSNAVTQPLPQLDPELAPLPDTVYIPIGAPQIDPLHPTQPLGDIATQADPALDPETFPESALESAASSMQNLPPDDPNLPNTGSGIVPIAPLPEGSAHALFSVYNPSQAQVDSFGAWLWSNNFVDQIAKIFNDPMESIISLHKIFATPITGSSVNIQVGYLDSGVSALAVTDQYTEVDCGSITLSEYFRNVYDYVDTDISLYLPFVGIVPLSVDDVMRAVIHVVYKIDVLTGTCLVDVNVTRDLSGAVLYQFTGNCAVHYPVSSGSYIGIVSGALSIAGSVASGVISGGAALPIALKAGSAALTRMHADVSRSGSFSANSGAMGNKIPYLIISRPQTALPENYLHFEGIGSNQTVSLASCTGLTKVKDIVLTGFDCTEAELVEIENLLKDGVYL